MECVNKNNVVTVLSTQQLNTLIIKSVPPNLPDEDPMIATTKASCCVRCHCMTHIVPRNTILRRNHRSSQRLGGATIASATLLEK